MKLDNSSPIAICSFVTDMVVTRYSLVAYKGNLLYFDIRFVFVCTVKSEKFKSNVRPDLPFFKKTVLNQNDILSVFMGFTHL